MAFGKEIKRLREDVPISVEKITDKIGVDAERWRKWEQKDSTPRTEDVQKIESFFGLTLAQIMKLTSIKKFLNVPRGSKAVNENDLNIVRGVDYHEKYIRSLEADKERLLKMVEFSLSDLGDGQRLLHAQVMAIQQWDAQEAAKGDVKKEDELKHQINKRVASNYQAFHKKDILAGNGM